MMIQGSNNPLVIQFDQAVDSLPQLVVSLWSASGESLKTWALPDMMVSGDTAVCPLTEAETANIGGAKVTLEAKGLDGSGNTVFWDSVNVYVKTRQDKVIRLTGA